MLNKLLRMITPTELKHLLFTEAMTPSGIGKLYNCSRYVVDRAIAICNIPLDKEIWRSGASYKQRRLALSGVKLTGKQNQMLIGSLLGDGRVDGDQRVRYSISQCAKHKEYLEWLAHKFEPFSSPIIESNTLLKASGKVYLGHQFYTIRHIEFVRYRELFYPEGKKIVPLDIGELLTPLAMAVWYCEDGSHGTRWRNSTLCTNGFTDTEVSLLINVLHEKFNIRTHLCYSKSAEGRLPMIYIGAKEGYDNFHDIVDPIVKQFDCFKHKLGR